MGSLATASLYRLRCKKFSPRSKRRVLGVRGRRARLAVAHTAMHASVTCERTLALHRFQAASASMPVASQSQACPSSSLAPSASRHAPHSPPRFSRPPLTRSSRLVLVSPLLSPRSPYHTLSSPTRTITHSRCSESPPTSTRDTHTHTHSLTPILSLPSTHSPLGRAYVNSTAARRHKFPLELTDVKESVSTGGGIDVHVCGRVRERERECVCVCTYAVHREE